MQLTPEQRKAIGDNCLSSSWQMLAAWRLQHMGSLNDEPDTVVDWLVNVNHSSLALAEEMLRFMGDRLWRIQLHPEKARDGEGSPGLRAVDVVCGGLCWTLWLLPRQPLNLLRISR